MCYKKKNELYHYGVLGQKWGVRRFQNADGSLTTAGKARYNKDSDVAAYAYARKYEAIANVKDKRDAAAKVLAANPKKFGWSKEASEYQDAMIQADVTFKRAKKTMDGLVKKYKDVKVDFLTEDKTGENYVRSELMDKMGNVYISEFYLGTHVVK